MSFVYIRCTVEVIADELLVSFHLDEIDALLPADSVLDLLLHHCSRKCIISQPAQFPAPPSSAEAYHDVKVTQSYALELR